MAINMPDTTVRKEGTLARGIISLVGVQSAFLIGGYIIHFYLGRKLGPADYGIFGVVMAFLVWMEVSLTGGFPYAIRKFGSECEDLMTAIARSAMFGQLIYSTLLFITALAAAPWIALLLNDKNLTGLIRLASLDIPAYAFYFCYTAVLNGRQNYARQSAAMLTYAVSKVVAVLLLVILGFGVKGAIIGNILASAGGLAAAMVFTGRLPKVKTYPIKKLISYAGGTAGLSVCFTLLISIDMFAVKALGRTPESVGFYTAANTLSRAPFYALLGIATATLPALSRAASKGEHDKVLKYVQQSLRFHMMILVPATAILSGTASGTIKLIYTEKFAEAAPALAILAAGLMLFGLLHALYNTLVAIGDIRTPLLGTAFLIITALALNIVLVPVLGIKGAATSSTATAVAGLIVSAVICARKLGGLIAPISAVRIAIAGALVYLTARSLHAEGIRLAAGYLLLLVIYFTAIAVMREIRKEDIYKIVAAVSLNRCREGKTG